MNHTEHLTQVWLLVNSQLKLVIIIVTSKFWEPNWGFYVVTLVGQGQV